MEKQLIESINKAISVCSDSGGGTVWVPEGNFVTGTVLLKSNVTLHLERNSILLGTDDISQYKYSNIGRNNSERPLHLPLHNNSVWSRALVLLEQIHNVTITGSSRIDGNTIVDKQEEEGVERAAWYLYLGIPKYRNIWHIYFQIR